MTHAVRALGMEGHPWQRRAKVAGLTQRDLARLLGKSEIAVSRGLRGHWRSGVPRYLKAVISAWELMTPEQREAWLRAMAETDAEPAAEPEPSSGG